MNVLFFIQLRDSLYIFISNSAEWNPVMEPQRVISLIVALLFLIIAIRKAQRLRFLALYFLHKRRHRHITHALLVTKIKGCNIGREKLRQDDGVSCGHIQDHKDGLKKCIVTQVCLRCGKITSGSQRTHLITYASWSGLNFQGKILV